MTPPNCCDNVGIQICSEKKAEAGLVTGSDERRVGQASKKAAPPSYPAPQPAPAPAMLQQSLLHQHHAAAAGHTSLPGVPGTQEIKYFLQKYIFFPLPCLGLYPPFSSALLSRPKYEGAAAGGVYPGYPGHPLLQHPHLQHLSTAAAASTSPLQSPYFGLPSLGQHPFLAAAQAQAQHQQKSPILGRHGGAAAGGEADIISLSIINICCWLLATLPLLGDRDNIRTAAITIL